MKELSPGDLLLGKYEIKRVLGSGGMGAVYHARQVDLGRDVAIKVPHPDALQIPGFLQRFTREAKTVAKLIHDNVVQVYEYHHSETDLFIVMEFVEGKDLQQFIKSPPPDLKVKDMAEILRMASEGLAYAHEFGIVHRDIKPQNIMIGKGSRGRLRVKIMDFGIAHVDENSQMTGASPLTMTGQAIGTPSYMAPEQVRGAGISSLTDVYSFGCVMFYVFSKRTPFVGTGYTIAAAHLSEAPPSVRSFLENVPAAYDRLVNHCMSKDPASRPQDAHELGRMIVEALAPIGDMPMADIWGQLGRMSSDRAINQASALTEASPSTPGAGTRGTESLPQARAAGFGEMTAAVDPNQLQAAIAGSAGIHGQKTQMEDKTQMPARPAATQAAPPPHAGGWTPQETGTTPAPQAQPAKKLSPLISIVVGVGLLAGVGIAGFMMFGPKSDSNSTTTTGEATPTATPVVATTPTPSSTQIAAATPEATPTPKPTPRPSPTPTPEPTSNPRDAALQDVRRQFDGADTLPRYYAAWKAATERTFAGDPEFRQLSDEIAEKMAKNTEMAAVPQGTFSMGRMNSNPDEGPVGTVSLKGYQIARYEVTALEFATFLNTLPRAEAEALYKPKAGLNVYLDTRSNRFAPAEGKELHPANGVSWDAADKYAGWISTITAARFRLPTEAEWERAARGRDNKIYPWGDSAPDASKARYNDPAGTTEVTALTGGKTATGELFHMSGNVAEWCLDWYDDKSYTSDMRENPSGPRTKPSSGTARRVVRGGSFESAKDDEITATRRGREVPDKSRADVGFRLVREN